MSSIRPLRVVTLNTWKNEGDLRVRWAAMGDGLAGLEPDVVLLQEVFVAEAGAVDTGAVLAARLGLARAYLPARIKRRQWEGRGGDSEAGLAVLVRGRIERVEKVPLPSDEAGGERVALLVEAVVGPWRVVVGNVHLSHLRNDDARRREQLETVLAAPAWHRAADVRVLGGDFNASADSSVFAGTFARMRLAATAAFPIGAAVSPTHPLPPREGRPGRAIDHLFALAPSGASLPSIVRAEILLDRPSSAGVWPSDHAAVLADLLPADS